MNNIMKLSGLQHFVLISKLNLISHIFVTGLHVLEFICLSKMA